MINRKAKSAVMRLASQFSVIAILGPRQSGKTTLAKMSFNDKPYITFDKIENKKLAKTNPLDFLNAFPDGAIIDEVQKVPEIFDAIKYITDENPKPGKFILTGSNQFNIKSRITESLAGRIGIITLLPLSIEELKDSALISTEPYEIIFKGMYHPLYDRNKNFNSRDWFENYITTYLDLDIQEQINLNNLSSFRKFIQFCAIYSGNIFSMSEIARDIGVSSVTIKSWLSILEASFTIYLLEPAFENLGKKLIKAPKLYFTDTGLLCHLLRIRSREELLLSKYKGAVVETFAFSQLLKKRTNFAERPEMSYFRDTNGFEIDFIAEWDELKAIEVKSDNKTEKKMTNNLKKYNEMQLKNQRNVSSLVYYLGDITGTFNGVKYISWKDW